MKHAVFGPSKSGAGGGYYSNLDHVSACLKSIADISGFVLGGGKGVEALAEQYARDCSVSVQKIAPNFHSLFGSEVKNPSIKIDSLSVSLRQAVFAARNDEIIAKSDRVIVFWDGEFFEIGQIIRRAIFLKKPVIVFPV